MPNKSFLACPLMGIVTTRLQGCFNCVLRANVMLEGESLARSKLQGTLDQFVFVFCFFLKELNEAVPQP